MWKAEMAAGRLWRPVCARLQTKCLYILSEYLQHPSFRDQSSERLSDLLKVTQLHSVPGSEFEAREVSPINHSASLGLNQSSCWSELGPSRVGRKEGDRLFQFPGVDLV